MKKNSILFHIFISILLIVFILLKKPNNLINEDIQYKLTLADKIIFFIIFIFIISNIFLIKQQQMNKNEINFMFVENREI